MRRLETKTVLSLISGIWARAHRRKTYQDPLDCTDIGCKAAHSNLTSLHLPCSLLHPKDIPQCWHMEDTRQKCVD